MAKMNWDRVHAEDKRRRWDNDSTTSLRPRRKRKPGKPPIFKVDYGITCATCGQMIYKDQYARFTVIGKLVHGHGCGPDTGVCATCRRPLTKEHYGTTNKLGVMVHAKGCPKKPATTTE